jgi:hypothetical protein
VPACHPKLLILREEVQQIVERALTVSRATLEREMPGFVGRLVRMAGKEMGLVTHEPALATTESSS